MEGFPGQSPRREMIDLAGGRRYDGDMLLTRLQRIPPLVTWLVALLVVLPAGSVPLCQPENGGLHWHGAPLDCDHHGDNCHDPVSPDDHPHRSWKIHAFFRPLLRLHQQSCLAEPTPFDCFLRCDSCGLPRVEPTGAPLTGNGLLPLRC